MSFDLRAERMNRGVTQAELAQITGISRTTLHRLERGATPLAGNALKLAEWVGRKPSELWPTEPRTEAAA